MNRKLLGVILTGLALGLPWLDRLAPTPGPVPNPAPAPGPVIDVPASVAEPLKSGFAGRKQEAATWAGLLYGLARSIESDASHSKGPRLRTMLDVQQLRDWVVACPPQPVGNGSVIGQALGPELAKLGTSDEPLDQGGRRSAVVKLFDGAAYTLEHVK